jgi:hypothetical protein
LISVLFYLSGGIGVKPDKPKKSKKDKPLEQWQVEELMGVNNPIYHRVKGGALKQK